MNEYLYLPVAQWKKYVYIDKRKLFGKHFSRVLMTKGEGNKYGPAACRA